MNKKKNFSLCFENLVTEHWYEAKCFVANRWACLTELYALYVAYMSSYNNNFVTADTFETLCHTTGSMTLAYWRQHKRVKYEYYTGFNTVAKDVTSHAFVVLFAMLFLEQLSSDTFDNDFYCVVQKTRSTIGLDLLLDYEPILKPANISGHFESEKFLSTPYVDFQSEGITKTAKQILGSRNDIVVELIPKEREFVRSFYLDNTINTFS